MGAAISVSNFRTSVDLAQDKLQLHLQGRLNQPIKDKKITVGIQGRIINTSDREQKITDKVKKKFVEYIKSDSFHTYANENLLKKAETPSTTYPFTVMSNSYSKLSWTFNNITVEKTETKEPVYAIYIECGISTDDPALTFSSTVSHMGQNFMETINSKNIPVFTIDNKNYSFNINMATFTLV